jgi:hypothetical protein
MPAVDICRVALAMAQHGTRRFRGTRATNGDDTIALNRCVEICYKVAFVGALIIYTPTLDRCSRRGSTSSIPGVVSLPLETRGRAPLGARGHGRSPMGMRRIFTRSYLAVNCVEA